MIQKTFPNVIGFSVSGVERNHSSKVQGGEVTDSTEYGAIYKSRDDVCLQSDVNFNVYNGKGSVTLTDGDATKNLKLHLNSEDSTMSVVNPHPRSNGFFDERVRVDVDAGKFQASPQLEESIRKDSLGSITMTTESGNNPRTEFDLERVDGTHRKLILEGGVLFELDESSAKGL